MKQLAMAATFSLFVAVVALAQNGPPRAIENDWPMFSHDFGGTRFSPLADINAGNVGGLVQAWSLQLTQPAGRRGGQPPASGAAAAGRGGRVGGGGAEEGDAAGSNPEVTPIVVNGVMYLPARGNQVLALDGDTGKEIWRYQMPPTVTTTARGVAYWPGDAGIPPRIVLTAGPRLLALDAATGQPAAGFGRKGMIEILVPWNGVPMIYKHVAVLGTPREVPLGPTGGHARIRPHGPARSSGSFRPCRFPARWDTRPGWTTAGAIGRAPTSGPSI